MADLMEGQLGPEGKYSLKLEGGKLIAEVLHDTQLMDSSLLIKLDASAVIDLLVDAVEKMVPGDQKAMAEMLKAAIKGAM